MEPGHYDFDERIGVRIESFYGVREHVFEEEGRGMKGSKWLSLERFTQVEFFFALLRGFCVCVCCLGGGDSNSRGLLAGML